VTGAKFRHAVAVLLPMRAKPVPALEHPVPAPVRTPTKATRPAASAAWAPDLSLFWLLCDPGYTGLCDLSQHPTPGCY